MKLHELLATHTPGTRYRLNDLIIMVDVTGILLSVVSGRYINAVLKLDDLISDEWRVYHAEP